MAHVPPNVPGGAPGPAPAAPRLTTLFSDAAKDPCDGDWSQSMAAFSVNVHNSNLDTETGQLKNMVAASGAQKQLMAYVIVHGGSARLYSFLFRWESTLTAPNPALHNKFFAIEGELIGPHGQGHIVEVGDAVFNKVAATVVVPDVATILAQIGADPTIATMGPYNAGDPDTEGVKSRKICAVPHNIAGLFFAHPQGVT